MRIQSSVIIIAVLAALAGCATTGPARPPLEVVPSVDPARYIGRWYEIARFQHSFEKTLVGATAEYALNADGTIAVVNSGFKKTLDGAYTAVKALARIPNPAAPARLRVKFFNLFEADYLIFGLDEINYSWALVGNDGRKYLWFLARTPSVEAAVLEKMQAIAVAQGYDLSGLYLVPQKARE